MTATKRTATKKPAPVAPPEPERSPEEQALVDQWHKLPQLHRPPKVARTDEGLKPTSDDHELWFARLAKVAGIDDGNLALKLAEQAGGCVRHGDDDANWNLAVAGIRSIAPRDGVEAMLATQMVATHHAALAFLRRAENAEFVDHMTTAGGLAVKLLRTYASQVEALSRYRNGGKQQVVVQHQHVGITADKAVVGIGAPAMVGGGVSVETEERPHAPQLAHAPMPPMPCANTVRDAVPVARREGQSPMQDAWRG